MSAFVAPGVACRMLGVHRNTLLRWEKAGRLPNTRRLRDGHRRFLITDLRSCLSVSA